MCLSVLQNFGTLGLQTDPTKFLWGWPIVSEVATGDTEKCTGGGNYLECKGDFLGFFQEKHTWKMRKFPPAFEKKTDREVAFVGEWVKIFISKQIIWLVHDSKTPKLEP